MDGWLAGFLRPGACVMGWLWTDVGGGREQRFSLGKDRANKGGRRAVWGRVVGE